MRTVSAGGAPYAVVKRLFDIAFSLVALAIAFIPAIILCLIIRLESPGFPIYVQKRMGRMRPDGTLTTFPMFKFRSMYRDADQRLDSLLAQNEIAGPMFKMHDDPRVTKVGRFIRKHSIDEVPQFINVLAGHMSVVGPRPPLPREVAEYTRRDMQRLRVRPGLTGYWQISGRSDLDFDEMIDLDLRYIEEASIMTDLRVVFKSVKVVLMGDGAY